MDYTLLPKLNSTDAAPAPGGADAAWYAFPGGREHLLAFANALNMPASNLAAERIKSTPNPWARALLFEQALFTKSHPAHAQIRAEWRGMLATLGLSGYLGVNVSVRQVRITGNASLHHLQSMLPNDGRALWDPLVLIAIEDAGRWRTIGATSPRTVVFTGIRSAVPANVPFVANGRFIDPTDHYLRHGDATTLEVLERWIGEFLHRLESRRSVLNEALGQATVGGGHGSDSRLGHIIELLRDWENETHAALQQLGGVREATTLTFGDSSIANELPDSHVLRALFTSLPSTHAERAAESNVLQVQGAQVLADPGNGTLYRRGSPMNGILQLPAGQSRDVSNGRVTQGVSSALDFSRLFERNLVQVGAVDADNAAVLHVRRPQGTDDYLYPFDRAILSHITAEQLREWTSIAVDSSGAYTVTLELPIGGGLTVRYARTYRRDEIVDNLNPPALAVWPDFEAAGWKDYFYASRQSAKRGARLQFEPIVTGEVSAERDAPEQGLRWGRVTELPKAWVGSDVTTSAVAGLLLAPSPAQHFVLDENAPVWDLSIDFGSTLTRVFRRERADGQEPKEVSFRPRVRMLVGGPEHLPFYFFSAGEQSDGEGAAEPGVPSLLWLPLGSAQLTREGWLPSDGHVFWGVKLDADQQGRIFGNLKWRHDDQGENSAFHSFVSQVFLSVAAEAAAEGARVGSLITAYPSVLPPWLRSQHQQEWEKVAERFKVEWRDALSESDAVVEYLVKRKQAQKRTNILAVDVGGSTSDFAIWSGAPDGPYLDSIQIAGSLFNRLLAKNADVREAVSVAAKPILGGEVVKWTGDEARDQILAGLLLRKIAREGTRAWTTFASQLYNRGPGSPGEPVLAHVAYLYAVLSFTLGMMTARQIKPEEDLFNIFFAGRGAHLLKWVDALGAQSANTLVTHFFLAGLGMDGRDVSKLEVGVTLPQTDAKEEVALGLLLAGRDVAKEVAQRSAPRTRTTFVGETCYGELPWSAPLTFETLRALDMPERPIELSEMKALQAFLRAFDQNEVARDVAQVLGIDASRLDRKLRGLIHDRTCGGAWQCARTGTREQQQHVVLEPYFIVAAKAVLDHVTGTSLFEA